MVYEHYASNRIYPNVLSSEDLLNIRANDVLGLVSRGSPYREQRKSYIASLTRKELRKVRSHLAKEAKGLRKQGESIERSLEAKLSVMPNSPREEAMLAKLEISSLRTEARWYDSREALYEKGVAYLDKML